MTATRRHSVLRMGVVVALAAVAVAGCTASAAGPDATPIGTVGDVGQLPGSFNIASDSTAETPIEVRIEPTIDVKPGKSVAATTVPTTEPPAETIGAQVTGNRLLMIGDSLTASISERYGGEACDALVPLGWEIEVDAETGRFIDFGARVLDKRLDAGWDAAILFLGNNYGYDRGVYQLALHSLLLRLAPRPTVLITTPLFRPQQAEVNAAILEEATLFDTVTVIDWETLGNEAALTGGDSLHLTDAGRARLGYQLAYTMGSAPKQPGKCLKTNYRNDSAGSPSGPAGNSSATKTTTKPSTPTTTRPKATTPASVTNPTATTATPGIASTSPAVTLPSSTTPPVTSPPTTTPPVTSPPTTAPPVTSPPTTAPPVTSAITLPPVTTPPPTTQAPAPGNP